MSRKKQKVNKVFRGAIYEVFGSITAYAEHLGVSRPYISMIVNGKNRYVSDANKRRLAKPLKKDVSYLFPKSGDPGQQ